MMKKLVFSLVVCYRVAGIIGEDIVVAMQNSDNVIHHTHIEDHMLRTATKHNSLDKQSSGGKIASDYSESDDSICSLSEEEEEIADRACYSKSDIVILLAHLQSQEYSEAKAKYNLILQRWNDNNIYELMDTGSSFIGCCERNYYDF